MREGLFALALIAAGLGCTSETPDRPAPENPGVDGVDSTTYVGSPFTPDDGDLVFEDEATGSRFNLMGQAFDGPLADGKVQLGRLPGMTAFWFAWSVHHPGARVWNRGTNNEGIELLGSASCGVPCDEIVSACFGGKDCIPSIDSPEWVDADDDEHLGYLSDDDRVLGSIHAGIARAYPLDALWTHEIVNDTLPGWEFSVTYCPLTGSGIAVDGRQDGTDMRFGVSGNLYNSNLVMYDRTTDSQYGQMRLVGFTGDNLGLPLTTRPLLDTTWGAWRHMFPDTQVLSDQVGVSGYVYGDYRSDHANTFMVTNPLPDPLYPNKSYAIGVTVGGETAIYAFEEIESQLGDLAIVSDTLGGLPILVAYDGRSQSAAVYSRLIEGVGQDFARLE